MRTPGALVVLALLALVGLPALLAAQDDPRLVAAVRQAQDGQGDSARAVVRRLLAATPTTDTLYPQIVYTAAMTAPDAAEMRRHLQRITVEYAASAWADDAALRLAQLDYAGRDLDGAARDLERIRQDYPDSPLFAEAAYWAARVYFDQNRSADACRWVTDGVARAEGDLELRHQLDYLSQRCGIIRAAPAPTPAPASDSTRRAPRVPPPAPPAGRADSAPRPPAAAPAPLAVTAVPHFRIQVAAVGTEVAARAAEQRAEALGLAAVTVREGGLYKVRVGGYATRAEAQRAVGQVKAKLGGAPFVVAER